MQEYTRICNFTYKNKKYTMFIDNKDKYYFLRINDKGEYEYVDIETFIELGKRFSNPIRVECIKKNKKYNITPKIIIGGTIVGLTFSSVFAGYKLDEYLKERAFQQYKQELYEYMESQNEEKNKETSPIVIIDDDTKEETQEITKDDQTEESTEESKDYESEYLKLTKKVDEDEEFQVDTYDYRRFLKALYIYDSDYLDYYLETPTDISLEDFNKIIDDNPYITPDYKKYIKEYCKDLITKQPDAERRILYENLKTLKIYECNSMELFAKTMSRDSLACYIRTENAIYVKDGYTYKPGTFEYQILYHELTHAARSIWKEEGEVSIRIQANGDNFNSVIVEEALDSLFAVSLFDYDEKDIAYQFQSNMIKLMIDNMDNYKISDYMNHSLSYFVQKLNEYTNSNYAAAILELLQMQYEDYHDDYLHIDQNEFYPLYDFIADMYYKNRITKDTTYEEARGYARELVQKISFDVPGEYEVNVQHFYDYLDQYCENLGIVKSQGMGK